MTRAARRAAEELLNELESSALEVGLVPQRRRTNEGGMIRVVLSANAPWYRRFCAMYRSSRVRRKAAVDTRIKRALTIRTLQQIAAGRARCSVYVDRLWPIVEARAQRLEASA